MWLGWARTGLPRCQKRSKEAAPRARGNPFPFNPDCDRLDLVSHDGLHANFLTVSVCRENTMTRLHEISGTSNPARVGDVLFIHGLDGDAISTWHPSKRPDALWPNWLGSDLPQVGVWSLDYDAASMAWKGTAMPLSDRATNVLAIMDAHDFGSRPLVVIAHSLGGLLFKQMLRHAIDFGQPEWKRIVESTVGIIFLSTPHSGSDIANWLQYVGGVLRANVTIEDLRAHDAHLRNLNLWFRNNVDALHVKSQVYFERHRVGTILVVDETSADPGIQGVIPIPIDANHINICKPDSTGSLLYVRTTKFINECLSLRARKNEHIKPAPKYFYYISRTKVQMLMPQMPAAVQPKLSGVASSNEDNVVSDALALISSLASAKLLSPVPSSGILSHDGFYEDRADWHSGLFSMNWMGNTPSVVYAMLRIVEDSIVLLVGSPNNILGEKIVSAQYFVPGTSGAQMEILEYVSNMFDVKEPVAVTEGKVETYGYCGPVPEQTNSPIRNPFRVSKRDWYRDQQGPSFMCDSWSFSSEEKKGVSLAILCLSQLRKLPLCRLELAFRVFSTYQISEPDGPVEYDFQREHYNAVKKLGVYRYKTIYLGSPLYTVLS